MATQRIIYTEVDEAPALATYSLLPILQAYTKGSGIVIETKDISLSARIIANFTDNLAEDLRIPDYLHELAELVKLPDQYHQTAEHQCLDPTIKRCNQRIARERIYYSRLP